MISDTVNTSMIVIFIHDNINAIINIKYIFPHVRRIFEYSGRGETLDLIEIKRINYKRKMIKLLRIYNDIDGITRTKFSTYRQCIRYFGNFA
jgi:hypothetical protein